MAVMKKRILIVEDEPMTALSEQQMLKDLGYEVTDIVLSGEGAVQRASESKPDLVLMDIKLMGDMDGLKATQKIRELHQIPVVFVTAFGNKETSLSLRIPPPEGIGYIVKPFTKEELDSEIKRLIG